MHLRRAAKRVRVLHLVAPAVRLHDRRVLEQAHHVRADAAWPRQRTQRVHLWQERVARALQRLERQRAGAVRARARRRARTSASAAWAVMNCVPLISDRPSFATRRTGSSPTRTSAAIRRATRLPRARTLADERQREVRQRGQIARRTDGAARRHERQHATFEAFEQQLDRLDARAGVALRKRVRAQQHGRPDDRVGVRISDPAGVRTEQTQLQLLGQLLRDLLRDEAAEAGVDAVGVLAASRARRARRPRAPRCILRGRASDKGAERPSTATAQTSSRVRSSPVRACVAVTRRV